MPRKPRANEELVAMLEAMVGAARDGLLTDVFMVYRCSDDNYDSAYLTGDIADLLCQVRSEVIKTQAVAGIVPTAAERHH
ncbi:MAG: hypothetical protein NDI84_08270 [Steroidobacteraceae bacterium]|nr:hypothetical protein [Steroidobacteraceae bacterium]